MSQEDVRTYCYQAMAKGSRSFWLASALLEPDSRIDVATYYTWCRHCDDAIDNAPADQQQVALLMLEEQLRQVYSQTTPDDLVLAALQQVVRRSRIPFVYMEELLRGMEMDVRGHRYCEMNDLYLYCYRVAGVVGLVLTHIFGVDQPDVLRRAAHMGMAMQLTNICRDVAEDWSMGRLYLPAGLLMKYGLTGVHPKHDVLDRTLSQHLRPVIGELLRQADAFYRSADAGLSALPWRSALAARAARLVYAEIGQRLRRRGCDALDGRTIVPLPKQLMLCGKALLTRSRKFSLRESEERAELRFPDDILPLARSR